MDKVQKILISALFLVFLCGIIVGSAINLDKYAKSCNEIINDFNKNHTCIPLQFENVKNLPTYTSDIEVLINGSK